MKTFIQFLFSFHPWRHTRKNKGHTLISIFHDDFCINIDPIFLWIHSLYGGFLMHIHTSEQIQAEQVIFIRSLAAATCFTAISFAKHHLEFQVVFLWGSPPCLRFAVMQDQFTITTKALQKGKKEMHFCDSDMKLKYIYYKYS